MSPVPEAERTRRCLAVLIPVTAGMLKLRAEQPPACATTLIVSLGIMASLRDAVCIMLAVVLMYAVHKITARQV